MLPLGVEERLHMHWRLESVRPAVRADGGVSREWWRATAPVSPHPFEVQPTHSTGLAGASSRPHVCVLREPARRTTGVCGEPGVNRAQAIMRSR